MAVAAPPFPIARFSVDQYHRMIESGAFTEDDRLELIEGWVVRKMAKGPLHEYAIGELDALLQSRLAAGWHVRNQAPITLATSEPEPDLTIARGSRSDYRDHHPGAADVALVVEVSDTTLATDRLKARTYAQAGIPELWIVNLGDRSVEVYRDPGNGEEGYRQRQVLAGNQCLRLVIGGQDLGEIPITAILP